jgi:hypothetical protein
MKRAIVLAAAVILFWARFDRTVWGTMFEPHQHELAAQYGVNWLNTYFWGLSLVLQALILVGGLSLAMFRQWRAAIWFVPTTWLLANSGLADWLYYAYQWQWMPARLQWLDEKYWAFAPVTPDVIVVSILAHVMAAAGLWFILQKVRLPDGIRIVLQHQRTG